MTSRRRVTHSIIFVLLLIGAVFMIGPLLWMLSTSFKDKQDVFALPPVWIPRPFHFDKYSEIWEAGPLLSGIKNSLIIAVTVTIVGTFTSSLAAFSLLNCGFRVKIKYSC